MTRKRKTFDPSLKLEVVRMSTEQGPSTQHVNLLKCFSLRKHATLFFPSL